VQSFQYIYKDQVQDASADHFTENGYNRYKISFEGGYAVVAPSGIPGTGTVIWVQSNQPGDTIYPHELIQAIGEGLEEARIY
jgi:hypothetical protein